MKWDFDGVFANAKAGDGQLTRYVRKGFRILAERGWEAPSGIIHYAMHMNSNLGPAPMMHCGKNSLRWRMAEYKRLGTPRKLVQITCKFCLHCIFGDLCRYGKLPGYM